jgi:hypothetical protein
MNRLMGFGKGEGGCVKATEGLSDALKMNDGENFRLIGVYRGSEPMGLFWVYYLGDETRTAKIHVTASNKPGMKQAFHKAGLNVINQLFENGVYRVEAEPLRINKRMVGLLRHYGFKQEGIKRSAFWMNNNDYDTVLLRMLRREWKRKEH